MNIALDTMKAFKGADEYQDRIVAFVDVMGMRTRMQASKRPEDLQVYSTILNMFANQPFAKGKVHVSLFSDCMYVVANKENVDYVINLLANFAYTLLSSNSPQTIVHLDGSFEEIDNLDCFKLRGGITYGKVFALDEAAEYNGASLHPNIVLGPAVIEAYSLESKAVYPRIIVDDKFLQLIENMGKIPSEYYLIQDDGKEYYLDFLDYMCQGNRENSIIMNRLEKHIDFIQKELDDAMLNKNGKLEKQLSWYLEYLYKHKKTS